MLQLFIIKVLIGDIWWNLYTRDAFELNSNIDLKKNTNADFINQRIEINPHCSDMKKKRDISFVDY